MIENREELIFALAKASELEHALLCQYLYAAFSLKASPDEGGVSWPQIELIRDWKSSLLFIARQEMEHLGYVCNLLTAIGAGPILQRRNFPLASRHVPAHIRMELIPFSREAIERFICFERPDHINQQTAFCRDIQKPDSDEAPIETIVALYDSIRRAFSALDERSLFIGPRRAQVTTEKLLHRKEFYGIKVVPVTGRSSALEAIDQIVAEGEGTRSRGGGSHYERLTKIRRELEAERERSQGDGNRFEPARPCVANPLPRRWRDVEGGTEVTSEATAEILSLFNAGYETMILMLIRFYAHVDETEQELDALQATAFWPLMTMFMRPLGEILTRLPVSDPPDGRVAGPSFHFSRDLVTLPHKRSAWVILSERLRQMSDTCARLRYLASNAADPAIAQRLRFIGQNLWRVSRDFEAILMAGRVGP